MVRILFGLASHRTDVRKHTFPQNDYKGRKYTRMSSDHGEKSVSNSNNIDDYGPAEQESVLISVVVPTYSERENPPRLYEELVQVLTPLDMTWELI